MEAWKNRRRQIVFLVVPNDPHTRHLGFGCAGIVSILCFSNIAANLPADFHVTFLSSHSGSFRVHISHILCGD